mmetsp:Transcript_5680/g.8819  ORF Transcript_5680/g.8819 Transcript_5680/m.8819 type:complete len:103 (-) Transcript_5680:1375-1683(-)
MDVHLLEEQGNVGGSVEVRIRRQENARCSRARTSVVWIFMLTVCADYVLTSLVVPIYPYVFPNGSSMFTGVFFCVATACSFYPEPSFEPDVEAMLATISDYV